MHTRPTRYGKCTSTQVDRKNKKKQKEIKVENFFDKGESFETMQGFNETFYSSVGIFDLYLKMIPKVGNNIDELRNLSLLCYFIASKFLFSSSQMSHSEFIREVYEPEK